MAKRANGEGSIYRRKSDGRWIASVTLGRDEATGKLVRKYVYGASKNEVLEKKTLLLEKSRGQTYVNADKITVGEWMRQWLDIYAKSSVRANTLSGYRAMIDGHIIPRLGNVRLQKLKGIDIQHMVNQIIAEGGSARLAEFAFSVLRIALNKAYADDVIERQPHKNVSLPKKHKEEFVPLTPEEWSALFAAAKGQPEMYAALVLEWATGISRSELLALKWSDLNFSADTVSILRADIVTDDGPALDDTKAHSRRRVLPIPPLVAQELKQHKARLAAVKLASPYPWQENDFVFPNHCGELQDPRYWSKKFSRLAKAAGVDITFHKLRHDHASRLSENGVSIKDAQYRLGHSTSQMLLDVYTHRMTGGQEKIAAWLNDSFPVPKE